MPSGDLGPYTHHSRLPSQLRKSTIRAGCILWLRKEVNEDEAISLTEAGMNHGALNHPVVVIDMLDWDASHVLICSVTSFGGNDIIASNINQRYWSSYLPIYPADPGPSSSYGPLRLKNGAQMRKNSYVNTRRYHQIQLALLERYDRSLDVSRHCLTKKSLDAVRAACDLPSLRSRGRTAQPAEIVAIPDPLQVTPTPPTWEQMYAHMQRQAMLDTIEGVNRRLRPLAAEQQPLLPAPVASRSQARRVEDRSLKQSEWQEYYQHLRLTRHQWNDAWDMERCWASFRAVCTRVLLAALLGYGIFLGVVWLAHSFMTLLKIIKADLAAAGHFIAGMGRTVATPFVTIGKGTAWLAHSFMTLLPIIKADIVNIGHSIAGLGRNAAPPLIAVGKAVPRLVEVVAHWIQELRRHV